MENDFFGLYERQSLLAIEVGHNSIADWCITIHDIKGKGLTDRGDPIIQIQESDRSLAFAKAYVQLCEFLSEHRCGY